MIESYVEIDFNLSLEQVASEQADAFDAIRPIVPTYLAYEQDFAALLKTVRKVLQEKREC